MKRADTTQGESAASEIFEGYPAPAMIVDDDVRVLRANRSAREMIGTDGASEPALCRRGGEALHCLHAEGPGGCGRQPACADCVVRRSVKLAVAEGKVHRAPARLSLRGAAGIADAWVMVSASSFQLDGQRCALLTLEDVTEAFRLQERVGERERRLSLVLECSEEGFWDLDLASQRWEYSPRCFEIVGEPPPDGPVDKRYWWGRTHPDDVRVARDALDRHLSGRAPRLDFEVRLRGAGGAWRWVAISGRVVDRGPSGRALRMAGTLRDVHERRKAEERLRDALATNERLVAELRDAAGRVTALAGLLPICAWCKRVRDDEGYWAALDSYLSRHGHATLSHGMCPDCYARVSSGL